MRVVSVLHYYIVFRSAFIFMRLQRRRNERLLGSRAIRYCLTIALLILITWHPDGFVRLHRTAQLTLLLDREYQAFAYIFVGEVTDSGLLVAFGDLLSKCVLELLT